jgi:flagellar biosynthesis protein FlhF
MKIIRHIAPDMRAAMRSIRAQLGEDAVILSSRKIPEGVEVTAAVDFDAANLQSAARSPAESLTPSPLPPPVAPTTAPRALTPPSRQSAPSFVAQQQSAAPANLLAAPTHDQAAPIQVTPAHVAAARAALAGYSHAAPAPAAPTYAALAHETPAAHSHAASSHYFPAPQQTDSRPFAHILTSDEVPADIPSLAPAPAPTLTAAESDSSAFARYAGYGASAPDADILDPTTGFAPAVPAAPSAASAYGDHSRRELTISIPAAQQDFAAEALAELPPPSIAGAASDAMNSELKILRRMLETQLAQLAWNDLTRRAPVHVEILRELTEIGITQDLSDYILKQLPDKVELGFARRFAIAGLSQYLLVTGDRWLENGGRVAFIGATGVGKTTTLAKLAVRWVLRHGTRDLALVGSDTVRIGAQDQIQSLGQLLGVPVYTPEHFESLPTLLSRLGDRHRLILIDTPGSSLRDPQLSTRLGVLSNCASQMETALVLAASTQAGALEETVKRYAPANPACVVLTKLDEAASLGGALSALIRARVPVSYVSEGQRVPEDLRPARALELVSTAVRLAKASGAAADEDLLRRRFGKSAHAIT